MDNEFSILDDYWMQGLMRDRKSANVLYHLLGGKQSHTVMLCQHRCNGWNRNGRYGEIISHEMLAKDSFEVYHSMTIRFISNLAILSEIKEHPLGELWEYMVNGKHYYCTPATRIFVYFLGNKLPNNALICRAGFPLMSDDLVINAENPMQIISTVTDDGSELAELIQYLRNPTRNRTEYGPLAVRVDELLDVWEERKQGDE